MLCDTNFVRFELCNFFVFDVSMGLTKKVFVAKRIYLKANYKVKLDFFYLRAGIMINVQI